MGLARGARCGHGGGRLSRSLPQRRFDLGARRRRAPAGKIFHAGTRASGQQIVTAGGRVLCAVGMGSTVGAAQREAYALVHAIHWDLVQYRRDIGYRAIEREQDIR